MSGNGYDRGRELGPGGYLVLAAERIASDTRADRGAARLYELLLNDAVHSGATTPPALLEPPDPVETAVLVTAATAIELARQAASETVFAETVATALTLVLRFPGYLRETAP